MPICWSKILGVLRLVRVGVVGLGKMGILHAGIVSALPDVSLAAISEKEGIIARAAKKIITNVPIYADVAEMVRKQNLDAVMITSPIHTHIQVIRTLLNSASTAIFTEKPLAANAAEAFEVAKATSEKKIINMVGYQKRFSPIFRHAKHLIEKEAIGEIQFFRAYSYLSDIFRQGSGWRFKKGSGGALLEHGPHLLDLVLWYFGDVKNVVARERSFYSKDVEDYVHAALEFESGTFGSLDISWSVRNYRLPETCLEVQGTNGTLKVSDDLVRLEIDSDIKGVIEAGKHTFQKPAFKTSVDFLLGEPEFTLEDKSFLEAVESKQSIEPSFRTAARVNQLIDRVHEEATGQRSSR